MWQDHEEYGMLRKKEEKGIKRGKGRAETRGELSALLGILRGVGTRFSRDQDRENIKEK